MKKLIILKLYIYLEVHKSKENPDSFYTANINRIPKPDDKVSTRPKKKTQKTLITAKKNVKSCSLSQKLSYLIMKD